MTFTDCNIEAVKIIDTRTTVLALRDDGIIRIDVKENAEIDRADAEETFMALKKLATGKKVAVLVVAGEGANASKEAREFGQTDEASEPTLAEALVVNTPAHRLFARIYLYFYRPNRPIRAFYDIDSAVRWLHECQLKHNA